MSLGDRVRASARRAQAGHGGGLAGPLLARLGVGGGVPADAARRASESKHGPLIDPCEEQPANAYDDQELAALRDEVGSELNRLTRPQNDEAPGG